MLLPSFRKRMLFLSLSSIFCYGGRLASHISIKLTGPSQASSTNTMHVRQWYTNIGHNQKLFFLRSFISWQREREREYSASMYSTYCTIIQRRAANDWMDAQRSNNFVPTDRTNMTCGRAGGSLELAITAMASVRKSQMATEEEGRAWAPARASLCSRKCNSSNKRQSSLYGPLRRSVVLVCLVCEWVVS